MTLLDTNVISEVMKPQPDAGVINWMNATATNSLFVSTITIAEIRYGIELLPDGRRRVDLEGRFEHFLSLGFSQRIVSFDERAASVYGAVMATRRRLGAPLASLDGQIAAIARVHRFTVATRNVDHFADCGVEVVNPFAG